MSGYVQVEDITNADQLRASLSRLYARRANERKPAPGLRLVEPTRPEPTSSQIEAIEPQPPFIPYIVPPYQAVAAKRAEVSVSDQSEAPLMPGRRILINDIIRAVARHYRVQVSDLLSQRRTPRVCFPRQVACYLVKQITTASLPEIGRRMGGRDHTTILHAVRKITAMVAINNSLSTELAILEHKIKNGEG